MPSSGDAPRPLRPRPAPARARRSRARAGAGDLLRAARDDHGHRAQRLDPRDGGRRRHRDRRRRGRRARQSRERPRVQRPRAPAALRRGVG
ncbi:MAG: hypothetical protein M3134_05025 [Actinomycetota bacterium]|nr:hypothetical protein [Actinomycetota bacterium]